MTENRVVHLENLLATGVLVTIRTNGPQLICLVMPMSVTEVRQHVPAFDPAKELAVLLNETPAPAAAVEANYEYYVGPRAALSLHLEDHEVTAWPGGAEAVIPHFDGEAEDFSYGVSLDIISREGSTNPVIQIVRADGDLGRRTFRFKNGLPHSLMVGYRLNEEHVLFALGHHRAPTGGFMADWRRAAAVSEDDDCHGVQEVEFEATAPNAPEAIRVAEPDGWFTIEVPEGQLLDWHSVTELLERLRLGDNQLTCTFGFVIDEDENGQVFPPTLKIVRAPSAAN